VMVAGPANGSLTFSGAVSRYRIWYDDPVNSRGVLD
jgi:hypothetical protein